MTSPTPRGVHLIERCSSGGKIHEERMSSIHQCVSVSGLLCSISIYSHRLQKRESVLYYQFQLIQFGCVSVSGPWPVHVPGAMSSLTRRTASATGKVVPEKLQVFKRN